LTLLLKSHYSPAQGKSNMAALFDSLDQ